MLGAGPDDGPPRPRPGMDPERLAQIERRIAELKAGVADGGPREAAIRALVHIGMAGPGVDERAFNTLRQIRAGNEGMSLEDFKQSLRAQYFSLVLDQAAALAAIPKMLPADAGRRTRILEDIRRTVRAAGAVTGEKAERLAQVERLFGAAASPRKAASTPRKAPGRSGAAR
jgi:DNA-binding transcriptional MerR regulator